ncbi:MAG TPA: NAD-dependent epimerase/dehydratase family protein [Microthrixaceae bacterium]|nr:NAD-dependent epimerase/dehydratase family protein [Microthrixaceae bacterium]HMT23991.1 NAD-dependent epimerase/dehydratase family protein [Microthrixaceae bacterium]HMT59422.1 NAD-dependent epimerase/dehydratase family protein [Microthrixaceae bacterium]
MKIVVTGGAGFIGANLCRTLAAHDAIGEVVALDNLSTGFRHNLDGVDATLVEGDLTDPDTLDSVLHDAAAVVHLGARPSVPRSVADPLASHHANATGTIQVLDAARRAGGLHVVVASSSSVYGSNPTLPKHEDLATRPLSPYAASKLATEAYALAYGSAYAMPTLAFRFFNVFGPLQAAGHAYAAVVPAFVSSALAGEPVTVHGDGTQSRDFTFVDTVASVITGAVVRRVASSEPVNLAFGTRTSLLDVIAQLETLLGHPIERAHVESRVGDVKHSQATNDRLRALFPDVVPVDLNVGLERTVEWFRSLAD